MSVRIGLRGFAGLLGSRLASYLAKEPNYVLKVGILRNDPTLVRLMERAFLVASKGGKSVFAEQMFLDETDQVVRRINEHYGGLVRFHTLANLDLAECDIVIDAASPGRNHELQSHYQTYQGPVVYQDGEYPRGRLMSPPFMQTNQGGNRFRQGGCILSGCVPLLAPFVDCLREVKIHLVMQYDGREADHTISERVNTFRVVEAYRPRIEEELGVLIPANFSVVRVIQIPSMVHYALSLTIEVEETICAEDVKSRLCDSPRVQVVPDSMDGSYSLNLMQVIDQGTLPISVLGSTVRTEKISSTRTRIDLVAALYHRNLAVLPNVDAVRILAENMDPIEAMKLTDRRILA